MFYLCRYSSPTCSLVLNTYAKYTVWICAVPSAHWVLIATVVSVPVFRLRLSLVLNTSVVSVLMFQPHLSADANSI
jgi:hypothetical protein